MDNGEVSALLAQNFTVCQDPSVSQVAIVNLSCCISQCIDSFKCFVLGNDVQHIFCYKLEWSYGTNFCT